MDDFSKYEIFEAAVKATKDKSLTLKEVEVQLKKLGFKANVETFSNSTKKAVVSQLKLERAQKQSDKVLILTLKKELELAHKQLAEKDKLIAEMLSNINSKTDQLPEIKQELADIKAQQATQPTLLDIPSTDESSSSQPYYSDKDSTSSSTWPQDNTHNYTDENYDNEDNDQ